jgi:hypothetical protein
MPVQPSIHIVCQFVADKERVTLTWSDGAGDFDPYAIERMGLGWLRKHVAAARKQLCTLVDVYQDPQFRGRNECLYQLAISGYEIYKLLFMPRSARGRTPPSKASL